MTHIPQIITLVNSSIFSSGIQCILEKADFKVIGEARHWDELFELLKSMHPDVVLIELPLNNESCTASLDILRTDHAALPVVLIINEGCENYLTEFINMGITGFVYSNTPYESLIKAIDSVSSGHEYFAEGILAVFKHKQQLEKDNVVSKPALQLLTPREIAVCKLFCSGLSYKEVATALFISPRTVETHKKNIFAKLKIKSMADLVKYALKHHLI